MDYRVLAATETRAPDPEFVAEVDRRCARAMALARTGAIRGTIVLHVMDDWSFWASAFGEFPEDVRGLAEEMKNIRPDS